MMRFCLNRSCSITYNSKPLTLKWEQEVKHPHKLGLHNTGTVRHRTRKCSEFYLAGLFSQPRQKVETWKVKAFTVLTPMGVLTLHSEDTVDSLSLYPRFLVSLGQE